MARRFGVSRQRVHQLARRLGLPQRPRAAPERVRVCPDCGERRALKARSGPAEAHRRCRTCASRVRRAPPLAVRCTYCGESYALLGVKRTDYLQQQKAGKSYRVLCPTCAPRFGR